MNMRAVCISVIPRGSWDRFHAGLIDEVNRCAQGCFGSLKEMVGVDSGRGQARVQCFRIRGKPMRCTLSVLQDEIGIFARCAKSEPQRILPAGSSIP